MKLEIGEIWIDNEENYEKQLEILGIEGWDNSNLSKGDTIVPESESVITVKSKSTLKAGEMQCGIPLRDLVDDFERHSKP